MKELERLVEVVARLRDKKHGCPWDSVQTNMSIRRYLVEEAGEYLDALEAGDDYAVRDELGDLLLQVVLNAQIAKDEGRFDLEDVAKSEADKMVRRHPHVFGTSDARTDDELLKQWERIKHTEKGYSERKSALDGVPRSVPGLIRAQKTASKAMKAGFCWPGPVEALAKVEEELAEVKSAMNADDGAMLEEELGDLLFAIAVLCQHKGIQAEEAMHGAIRKFSERFRKMESLLEETGAGPMAQCGPDVLGMAWRQAKAEEGHSGR